MSLQRSSNVTAWCIILLYSLGFFPISETVHFAVDISGFNFDLNDIFSAGLMPSQILFNHRNNSSAKSTGVAQEATDVNNTDLNSAFTDMSYHRQMMNQFLVTDYITQQILTNKERFDDQIFMIGKRIGIPQIIKKADSENQTDPETLQDMDSLNPRHTLLNDEGSRKYKSWLDKMTMLGDIQEQIERKSSTIKKPQLYSSEQNRRQIFNLESNLDGTKDHEEDIEDGDITGYALSSNPYEELPLNTNNNYHWPTMQTMSDIQAKKPFIMEPINKKGYENTYVEYGVPSQSSHYHSQPHPPQTPAKSESKEVSIKDITDIALTTLAFLSFGMFILQVLMCITMSKEDTNNMMMLPMEVESSELPGDGTEEIRRRRRSIPTQTHRLKAMNELSRRVLFSIDAALHLTKDKGSYHYWSLCENNRFAQKKPDEQTFWIPVWSLGMSWLVTRLKANASISSEYVPIMQSLKAIVIGLSNKAACHTI